MTHYMRPLFSPEGCGARDCVGRSAHVCTIVRLGWVDRHWNHSEVLKKLLNVPIIFEGTYSVINLLHVCSRLVATCLTCVVMPSYSGESLGLGSWQCCRKYSFSIELSCVMGVECLRCTNNCSLYSRGLF